MERAFREERSAARLFGDAKRGRLYQRRIKDLEAVAALADMSHYPGGCHPLKGERKGLYSLALWAGMRLVFTPDHNPLPRLADGGIDLSQVTAVEIVTVENYH